MKTFLSGVLLVAFSFAVIGCEASVKTGDPDTTNSTSGSYEKKTVTKTAPNGDTTTHTEMKSSS